MKKPIAILLLAIYLFNLVGYSLVFHYFIQQSEQQFARQLDDNQYKDAELFEISIPFNLPYTQNSIAFERLEGSVEVNGVVYNYVKRRIFNDTLHIMCLPNRQKTQLLKEKSTYAGEVNDFSTAKKEKAPLAKKASPVNEYNITLLQYRFALPAETRTQQNNGLAVLLPDAILRTPARPPQLA